MPQFTKNAISEAFFRIASKKAPEKITVKDIVEECGVTRNTFYYYFKDVYDVVEDAFRTAAAAEPAGETQTGPVGLFYGIADFLFAHRSAVRNICSSVGYDAVESYLARAFEQPLYTYIRQRANGMRVSEQDVRLITDLIRKALLGILMEWLRGDRRSHPAELLDRVSVLCKDLPEQLLQRAENT